MTRNMSFFLTTQQVRDGTKTQTRRIGWWTVPMGTVVNAVVKSRGLKRGERVECICQIRIIDKRTEALEEITQEDVIAEGFPDLTPYLFVLMFLNMHKGATPATLVNRIEFEYIQEGLIP